MILGLVSLGLVLAVLVVEVVQVRFDFANEIPHQAACGCSACAELHGDQALTADEVELVNLRRRCREQVAEIESLRAQLREKSHRLLILEARR